MHRIVLAGGSGFLGRALAAHFAAAGWDAVILTRSPSPKPAAGRDIPWDAQTLGDWSRELDGADAVVNLTGRTVNCRYNARNRREILESRVHSTRVVGQAVARAARPPPVWLNAGTATVYTHTYGPPWDESGPMESAADARDKFSVEVAHAWEKALDDAPAPATRKIALRTSMVLGADANSVFPVLRRLARCGLGGRMGDGRQFVSWIHQADFCRAVEWMIARPTFTGPVNLCAPNPVTNAEMMQTFRDLCGLPYGLPATEWMLEIGAFFLRTETELILKSRRVIPGLLLQSGFEFRFPTLRAAVEDLQKNAG